jgi:hypothetical protein
MVGPAKGMSRMSGTTADFSAALLTMKLRAASVEMTVFLGMVGGEQATAKATADFSAALLTVKL